MSASVSSANGYANTSAPPRSPTLSADMGTFLTLLTTQLRTQDPTQPMDANQLTQQLVQFATVEQQLVTNQSMSQLISLQQSSQMTSAAMLIGARVEVESDQLPLQGGVAEVILPGVGEASGAARARITITDSSGKVVREETVAIMGGTSVWAWDGRDMHGEQLGDGAYNVVVDGFTETGVPVPFAPGKVLVGAIVTGVSRADNGMPVLRFGPNVTIPMDRLRGLTIEG